MTNHCVAIKISIKFLNQKRNNIGKPKHYLYFTLWRAGRIAKKKKCTSCCSTKKQTRAGKEDIGYFFRLYFLLK